MIKTFFAIDDFGMSDKAFGNIPTDGAKAAESPKSCSHESEAVENGNQGECITVPGACDSSPLTKRLQTDRVPVSADEPAKKLQKTNGEGTESTAATVATEEAILELAESRNGVRHFPLKVLPLEPLCRPLC